MHLTVNTYALNNHVRLTTRLYGIIRCISYYSVMMQCYYIKHKHTSNESIVRETRKATVETILKQLEYITKGNIATQTILF